MQILYPGPGHYNHTAHGKKGQKCVFGKQARKKEKNEELPGT